ncbi:hypothetical protein K788_0006593 [Paraburkholderia caribensis MBA4]|uniref:Uncharacterized protein n=1 Tax=Paraburkholderia caribensis MBA4 TaxID=1323664 RepID=A0A0P0R831_9BURK|nr:hypothetical protein K788_0006593 [Paraburkholderia caribensis MBA4]
MLWRHNVDANAKSNVDKKTPPMTLSHHRRRVSVGTGSRQQRRSP